MNTNFDNITKIRIDDYFYHLPDNRIAKYPLEKRDSSKLLVNIKNEFSVSQFSRITDFIPENSLLIVNDTKVIQARLIFQKFSGARIEIFCLEPFNPADFIANFQQKKSCVWKCTVGNNKKWKSGTLEKSIVYNKQQFLLTANKVEDHNSYQIIEFSWDNEEFCFSDVLEQIGETPIPPYLNRQSEAIDKHRYQTLYSINEGSVAAPTAGLHFTNEVISNFHKKDIQKEHLTLHVGAGTFKPVKSNYIVDHEMHTEHFFISRNALNNIISKSNQIIAVGTTSLRTLESLYWLGVKIIKKELDGIENDVFHISQWFPYENTENPSPIDSLKALSTYLNKNNLQSLSGSTQLMIVPGYDFKIAKGLITNFHQPKSTLLLLIAAFIGCEWKNMYEFAIKNSFRFLSYGDSSILLR